MNNNKYINNSMNNKIKNNNIKINMNMNNNNYMKNIIIIM